MIEKWLTRLAMKIRNFFKQAKIFKIKANIVVIVVFYFVLVLATQITYALINLNYTENSNEKRDIQTVSHYINQAALNIRLELERLEKMSMMVYDESMFYFEEKSSSPNVQGIASELNTIINMIFKINEDISGLSIYRPKGGMIAYTNPYSPYYFLSGTKSIYSGLIEGVGKGSVLMRSEGDTLGQSMLSIKVYQPKESVNEYAVIAMEKNWGERKQYFKDLGLLNNGSIAMINEKGEMLMSFRNENAIGDQEIIRSGKLNSRLNGTSGVFQTDVFGVEKYIFYDKTIGSGCTLLYVAGKEFFTENTQGTYFVILFSSLFLIIVNIVIVVLFNRKIYRPITNVENALHAIVSGETEFKLENVKEGNELYPLYNDLNSLTDRLKKLIDSEYTAGLMKKQAEIDALQSQINPHFLYNTLESIRGQAIVEEVEGIEKMVKSLADIFRYSITNKNAMVSLEEELKNIDNYLNIQQFRFNNKFIVIKDIEEDTKKCLIPKLIIQPLVENAIIHGLETKVGNGTIKIKARATVDSVVINIEDDGEGIEKEKLDIISECLTYGVNIKDTKDIQVGLGLININERIKLIFSDSYGLKVYSIRHVGTNVELRIPKNIK